MKIRRFPHFSPNAIAVAISVLLCISFAEAQRPTDPSLRGKHDTAEKFRDEANILSNVDSRESLRASLEKYSKALEVYREIGSREVEIKMLNNIGDVHRDLGENQKALEFYNLALPIWKEVGDRRGEAKTLVWSLDGALRYIPIGTLSPDGSS